MAFSYNTLRAIPRLTSYADALSRYNTTPPIRGDANQTRPLGLRRMKWLNLRKEGASPANPADANSICIYYGWNNQPVIRFRTNDEVLVYDASGSWIKASFNELICAVLGIRCDTYQGKMWVYANGKRSYLRPGPAFRFNRETNTYEATGEAPENIFIYEQQRDEASGYRLGWRYINPPTVIRHRINRRAMREVKERYAAGITYVMALAKLRRDAPPSNDELHDGLDVSVTVEPAWNRTHLLRTTFPNIRQHHPAPTYEQAGAYCKLLGSSDTNDQLKAYFWAALHCGRSVSAYTSFITDMLLAKHRYKTLDAEEVETVKPTKDNYAWVFKLKEK